MNVPPIFAPNVTLRFFVPEDAPKIFAMSQERGLREWLPDQVYDSEDAALDVLRYLIEAYATPGTPTLAPYVLGVCLAGSSQAIGHVGLSPLHGDVEIGYAIENRCQGQGLASQAVKAMSEWALVRFALPRILGIAAGENVASCKVLEHAGFDLVEESPGMLHGRSGLIRKYQKTRHVA